LDNAAMDGEVSVVHLAPCGGSAVGTSPTVADKRRKAGSPKSEGVKQKHEDEGRQQDDLGLAGGTRS